MIDRSHFPLLAGIDSPTDLRKLPKGELRALADELRAYLIESVAGSGGHFGAGLGVVELTVALHRVFNTPDDRLVWDVGHQCYPHKILTSRRDRIHTIKKKGGLAPFPRRTESEYDTFGVGHSSTSISAALGMAIAHQRPGDTRKVVAVIGDGALTAGMAFEAMNHAGDIQPDLLVVFNDNGMSISESVGAMAHLRAHADDASQRDDDPNLSVPSTLFRELGFHYTGPVDGHDIGALVDALHELKGQPGPRLLHVLTTKGKGYAPAESAQIDYHAVTPFDPIAGLHRDASGNQLPTWSQVFGDWLCDMAATDQRLYGITPAMREGSGMVRFSREYPERYFDVAIAEQHAVTLAAGLACEGMKPVVAIYSTFLQRAFDQVIHDVALQNLDVTFAIDRAGIVGPDGATHNGSFDLSFLRCLPNLVIMAPADADECRAMLTTSLHYPGPAAVRYPRGRTPAAISDNHLRDLPIGKAEIRRQGHRLALLSFGAMLAPSAQLADELDATLVNMRFIKPLDEALILDLATSHDAFVTLEDNVIAGGAGSAVAECLAAHGITLPILHLGLPDAFLEHGTREEVLAVAKLDIDNLRRAIQSRFAQTPTDGAAHA